MVRLNRERVIKYLTIISIMTTSFDIVGNIEIGGITVRLTQIVLIPVFLCYVSDILRTKKLRIPVFLTPLLIWMCLQLLLIIRSPVLNNAIGYGLWLVFNVIVVFSSHHNLGKCYSFEWFIKIYLNSFVYMAVFGLIQFVLFLGGINLFVTQSWTLRLARINGFTFEPSYFATYLLIGFVTISYLFVRNDSSIFKTTKEYMVKMAVIASAIILSSSRMGWLMVFLWLITLFVIMLRRLFTKGINRKVLLVCIFLVILAAAAIPAAIRLVGRYDYSFLLSGMGIRGASAHSVNERMKGLMACIDIFRDSPWIGYSLGGVDPMIAQYQNISYASLGGNGAAMSIIGELLVANGIVGLIPLAVFVGKMLKQGRELHSIVLSSLKFSFVFEVLILCFNQNILRPYLWWHVAAVCMCVKWNRSKVCIE